MLNVIPPQQQLNNDYWASSQQSSEAAKRDAEQHQNRVRFLIKRIAAHADTFTAMDMPRIEELAFILMKAVQGVWEDTPVG